MFLKCLALSSQCLNAQITQCPNSQIQERPDGIELTLTPFGSAVTTFYCPYDFRFLETGEFVEASKMVEGQAYFARTFYHSRQCYSYSNIIEWKGGQDPDPTFPTQVLPNCGYSTTITGMTETFILSSWNGCGVNSASHQWQIMVFQVWMNVPYQNREDILRSDMKVGRWYRLRSTCDNDCEVFSNPVKI